jgi:predicted dehydrogenase
LGIPFAIVGCGGMGLRHLLGLKELLDAGLCTLELVAVCDLRRDNAAHLADEAERLLGGRPFVYDDLARMSAALPDLQAVDIATDVRAHHALACAALDLGLHVLCEKPLALTVRGCNRILEAQRRSGKVLSVAENYRRDPMSRLTRATLDAGAVGAPYLYLDTSVGAGNRIVITPWRHGNSCAAINTSSVARVARVQCVPHIPLDALGEVTHSPRAHLSRALQINARIQ